MRAAARYFGPANKVSGRPVGKRYFAARGCGVVNPDLSTLDDENALVVLALIEDSIALPNHDPAAEFAKARPLGRLIADPENEPRYSLIDRPRS